MTDASETANDFTTSEEPPIRVMALHALLYCPRLFYLEEVEGLYEADDRVYAGRRLHEERVPKLDDDSRELRSFEVSSDSIGLFGKVDAARIRDGGWVAYEHKKGRCKRASSSDKTPMAWPSDRMQVAAYAMLLEEQLGQSVTEGRIRYHQDNVTVCVPIDDAIRAEVHAAVEMMRQLRRSDDRPPVTDNEKLCRRCSLRVVCLPEEERITTQPEGERDRATLFPSRRDRRTLHVTTVPATVKRSARQLHIETEESTKKVPMEQVDAVVLYGGAQITSQAIAGCVYEKIAVQWVTAGGRVTGMVETPGRVRQRIRQFTALTSPDVCLQLARVTVVAKIQFQLQYLLRGTRGNENARAAVQPDIEMIRRAVSRAEKSESIDSLRGEEGIAARHYFASFNHLLTDRVAESLRMNGRTKHPPRDRLNCLLSFGYSMIFGLVQRTILTIGLEPSFGYFHQPRSTAPPLVMDVMELFRTLLWEMPLVGSLNRGQWDETADFEICPGHVWLSDEGRKKAIKLFEMRLTESYRHPHTEQSLEYGRMVELELRLLEKEWSGASGGFGQLRIR
ncbi:CRISPR-associated protein Cas4/endonuclease Cas1 fusion [Novipirellula aureliae]|uniref:CRISPR-associated endonuclease Cas1 n=1 Tax=Novipirellula aureliae TaxID=2527966 RepID=A0A5C6E839_9BACT|nr:type I-MYXAN CRISPR-associated endonuclease Cas1 [Novipirellula aureliae]TWU43851.1 CRISPR-associated protein Cas4/endonuclease Cas1 fusion [Novipirellula aureliae]